MADKSEWKTPKRREGRWTPIWAKAQDTRANSNSWETHLVRKRWDIGLLRALSLWIMMMMMSLSNKLPEISLLLAQTKLSVLALTETWLNDDQASNINIPGFTFVHRSRVSGIRGGVGFFIS